MRHRRFAALGLVVLLAGPARAADPVAEVNGILARLEGDPRLRVAASTAIAAARRALDRARSVEQAGDGRRALLLRAVALEWARVGDDLVRVLRAETDADEAERALVDVETKTVRGQALLEETVGRRARARAQLAPATNPASATPAAATPVSATPAAPTTPPAKGSSR